MPQAETIVLLFALVAALVVIAQKSGVPYPIVLVLAGLTISFIPRLPQTQLNPNIVFYFFLPLLIYPAALFTSWRDFRRNLRPILLLSIGLVLVTTIVVGWVAHAVIPEIPWAAAFALGAIVSPPDAIAATAIIRRLPVPHDIEAVLEGESLVNDATALVALQFAVVALMTGTFSLGHATGRFVLVAVGGIAFGLFVGLLARWIQRHLDDPPVQIMVSLLTPFVAYLSAERMHISGVLAVVTVGIYMGWHSPVIVTARFRLQAFAFWEMVVFLLNGFIFIIIGLQLPTILHAFKDESLVTLGRDALLVSAAVVLVRIGWVFTATYLPRFLFPRVCQSDPCQGWRETLVVAWSGMRGVISLAAAFALPFALADGRAFPGRNYILFLTFCVILTTLVFQGLTLPVLIRGLRIKGDGMVNEEERTARVEANKAAMHLIENVATKGEFSEDIVSRLRAEYVDRLRELGACAETRGDGSGEVVTPQYRQLQCRALQLERQTIIRLRNARVINDSALRRIQRDLDLAEARLEEA